MISETSSDDEYICFTKPMARLQASILPCMKKLFFTKALMIAVVLLIALFEAYWLTKLYKDEYNALKKEADVTFRETIFKLQRKQFEKDTLLFGNVIPDSGKATFTYKRTFSIKSTNKTVDRKKPSIQVIKDTSFASAVPASLPNLIQVIMKSNLNGKDSNVEVLDIDTTKMKNGAITITNKKIKAVFFSDKIDTNAFKDITPKDIESITILKRNHHKIDTQKLTISPKPRLVDIAVTTPKRDVIKSPIVKYFTTNKFFNDSIPPTTVDSAYKTELANLKRNVPYCIVFKAGDRSKASINAAAKDTGSNFITSTILTGFKTPYTYTALFSKVPHYLLGKMQMQIIGSGLLLLIVMVAFWALYYNLNEQRKLAAIKNEFISNITHELKTPIATVTVAIEALQRFNAMDNPERTQSYLNISAAELQRLSLLVDKVLKLSMFENKSIELNKEWMDVEALINEVMSSMKLQFDKHKAVVNLHTDGNSFVINADKLHIASVVYNLLDNALKYSKNIPEISISLVHHETYIDLMVQDNGIGISKAYKDKVFEKFFRVPTDDRHNIKGYGLGLSYVAHIAHSHNGYITVDTQLGKGSTFTVKLPIKDTDAIDYGNGKTNTKRGFKIS